MVIDIYEKRIIAYDDKERAEIMYEEFANIYKRNSSIRGEIVLAKVMKAGKMETAWKEADWREAEHKDS